MATTEKCDFNCFLFRFRPFVEKSKHVTTHWDKPGISADMYQIARSLVRKIGYLESEENEMSGCDTLGSILIFLPGIFEIGRLYNMLTEYSA